jgi:hypothetical protein
LRPPYSRILMSRGRGEAVGHQDSVGVSWRGGPASIAEGPRFCRGLRARQGGRRPLRRGHILLCGRRSHMWGLIMSAHDNSRVLPLLLRLYGRRNRDLGELRPYLNHNSPRSTAHAPTAGHKSFLLVQNARQTMPLSHIADRNPHCGPPSHIPSPQPRMWNRRQTRTHVRHRRIWFGSTFRKYQHGEHVGLLNWQCDDVSGWRSTGL